MIRETAALFLVSLLFIAPSFLSFNAEGFEESEEYLPFDRSDWDVLYSKEFQLLVPPGSDASFNFDPETGSIDVQDRMTLSEECLDAISASPEWIRNDLAYKLSLVPVQKRYSLAAVINNAEDDRYIDEIAFSIAHLPVDSLVDKYFLPAVLEENARYIYEHDQYLQYVEILELENFTTLRYKNQDNISTDLDPDIYYWYVVHPKLSDELPTYIDPDYDYTTQYPNDRNFGVAPPAGRFWREYLFNHNKSGQPLLKDSLEDCYTVWDGINAINGWVSSSMRFTSDNERPIQPVRIYQKGIGRCGEHQDLRGAAARAALIPVVWTLNIAEDHVWNEFWDGRWVHWDGMIDKPLTYENGWGKTISSVWNLRGDGHTWPVTSTYSEGSSILDLTVKDSKGRTVDGADVIVATESFYDNTQLTYSTWGITDGNGNVRFELGDSRDFWVATDGGDLGEYPAGGSVTQVISNSIDGQTYSQTFNLPNSFRTLNEGAKIGHDPTDATFRIDMDFEVGSSYIQGSSPLSGDKYEVVSEVDDVTFFFLNEVELARYRGGDTFRNLNLTRGVDSGSASLLVEEDDIWTGVFTSEKTLKTWRIINVTVDVLSVIKGEIEGPAEEEMFPIGYPLEIEGNSWSPWGMEEVMVKLEGQDWEVAVDISSDSEDPFTSWEVMLDTSECDAGANKVIVMMNDGEHIVYLERNIQLMDNKDPIISDLMIINEAPLKHGDSITINGTVSDNHRIGSLGFSMKVIAPALLDITDLIENGSFSLEFDTDDLAPMMEYSILFVLEDASGNQVDQTVILYLLETDPPVIDFVHPQGEVFKTGSTISVEVIVDDEQELETVIAFIDDLEFSDITRYVYGDTYEFEIDTQFINLGEGEHQLKVVATDPAGSSSELTTTFILDGNPPVIKIDNPMKGALFNDKDDVIIEASIEESFSLSSIDVYLNGRFHISLTDQYDLASKNLSISINGEDLKDGMNSVEISISDLAGWMSTTAVEFTVDGEVPEVSISSGDLFMKGDPIEILGNVDDDIGIDRLEMIIDQEDPVDVFSSLSDTILFHVIDSTTLSEGDHEIIFRAHDLVGSTGEMKIEIEIITNITDSDKDGMPDWWEIQYEGLDRFENDSVSDLDSDGVSNLDEYLGQDGEPGNDDWTDPMDVSSFPVGGDGGPDSGNGMILILLIFLILLMLILAAGGFLIINRRRTETLSPTPTQGIPPHSTGQQIAAVTPVQGLPPPPVSPGVRDPHGSVVDQP